MSEVRFFTDEDIHGGVAVALCRRGLDAISTPEAGRRGETDERQLEWAANNGRAIVTFNVAHFATLHASWSEQGKSHAGIIVSSQRPIGDVIRRLQNLAAALTADEIYNQLVFLGDW
jgi:hypothetical protein